MNIALDIDDVLLDNTTPFLEFLRKKGYRLRYEEIDTRRLWELLGCSRQESEKLIWEYYASPLFRDMAPVEGAAGAIRALQKKAVLCAVTNRSLETKAVTEGNLRKHFGDAIGRIAFAGQFLKSRDEESAKKAIIEDELRCAWCIDDDQDVIEELDKAKVRAILFARPWNRETEGAIRAKGWGEILSIFR